jgi:hypothetical protein
MKFNKKIYLLNQTFGVYNLSQLTQLFKKDADYFYPAVDVNVNSTQIFVIFTSGIVDGSPQPITYKLCIIDQIPIIGRLIWEKIEPLLNKHRYLIQSAISYAPTSLTKFNLDLNYLGKLSSSLNVKIILLETPLPHPKLEFRSPGVVTSIVAFNKS